MDIRIVSTLDSEDEDRLADSVAAALADLLERLPIGYALQIMTNSSKVVAQRTNLKPIDEPDARQVPPIDKRHKKTLAGWNVIRQDLM